MNVVKSRDEDRFLLVVAYACSKMPARGADGKLDLASPEVLEKAAWKFAQNGFKTGLFHEPGHGDAARVVESFIHRGEPMVFKSPDGSEQTIGPGDWVVGLILSPEAWQLYKAGKIRGASPQGTCKRKPVSKETLTRIKELT